MQLHMYYTCLFICKILCISCKCNDFLYDIYTMYRCNYTCILLVYSYVKYCVSVVSAMFSYMIYIPCTDAITHVTLSDIYVLLISCGRLPAIEIGTN